MACASSRLRLGFARARAHRYTNAQLALSPLLPLPSPPLRLIARARSSHPAAHPNGSGGRSTLVGTAGFGFWNAPFSTNGSVLRLPEAVWFFYASPPSQMELVPGVPGWGWKAQVVHTQRPGALVAGLPTLAAITWGRLTGNQRPAARWVQHLSGAHESVLDTDFTAWHDYALEWTRTEVRFWVDGALVFRAPDPPTGPLHFVTWIDNQYALATPRGQFHFGTLSSGPQWLELDSITITPL